MIKILQGSAVTQIVLGELAIYPQVASFIQCICAKNYDSQLTVDKVIAIITMGLLFGPPCTVMLL